MDKTSCDLPGLLVRQPIPADARAIATLHIRSWQATYRGLLSDGYLSALDASVDRRVAFLSKAIEDDNQAIRVAELDGSLVGWSSFGPSRDEDARTSDGELKAIYLDPQAWGLGIGPALWAVSREVLVVEGFQRVSAWVLDGNERASRFYRKLGFTAETASQRTFEENGEPLPLTRYHLQLNAG
ncbi:GNAT family N-acetyltransferase [Pseudomonas violetae]|jgi:ribosomal protein S18 acetylase RimI-like enzyme|uniref:GNAT family N-acetyltransferase n=1 Tax=Pseudomonas violetae TaxID=2915813 RepID=A0ABT0EZ87_9PSED|nr:GNAT family N-acetyltransferase [Pseudomonas violetae]MCK1791059.1 GNAT family N-acetyltransferase [Pseudomonas violetae]